MLNKKTLTTLLLLCFCQIAIFAQEEEEKKKFSLSGSIDAYFRGNIGAPYDVAPGSSFAQLPGFALGMANVVASYEGEKAGFVADLVFGPRGTDAIFNSPMYSQTGDIVNQLYAYWNVSESVTLTLGNFNTFLGYEVISPTGNFNYSTSYLFSYGPFSHTGLKADIALSDDFSLMLAVMNPTDATEFNPNGNYAFGAQLGYSDQYLNFLYDGGSFEIDYTGGFDASEEFFIGINAAYQANPDLIADNGVVIEDVSNGFYGVALYPQYTVSDDFSLGLRGEYFGNHVDIDGAEDLPSILALTLSGNYSVGDLMIIPELRLDSGSNTGFYFEDGEVQESLSSFVLAAVYKF